jgi:hypothetical protein
MKRAPRFAKPIAAVVLLASALVAAQVSVERQAAIVVRALSYDKNLGERAGDSVVVLVLSRHGDGASEALAATWVSALKPIEGVSVQNRPFKVQSAPWDPAVVKTLIEKSGVDVLLVCDGLQGDAAAIRALSRELKVLTVATSRAFVEQGMSLAVIAEGERNVIVVNLAASRLEGAALSSDLLKLAKLVD